MNYNISSSSLPTVCCLFYHFIVKVRPVKSTLGLSPAVCQLRVYVRSAALCCVSGSQLSWHLLSYPSNQHETLWLWTATFLCVCLYTTTSVSGLLVCLCMYCMRDSTKVEGVCLLAWQRGWVMGRVCFHQFRQWEGAGRHSKVGLSMRN